MATFENPNFPVQPQKGVYGWYAQKDGKKTIAIYIGNAGERPSLLPKGTLNRGVSELQRNTFTTNEKKCAYSMLDTDFIVGTAIRYFEKHGYSCVWKHISNEPSDEDKYVNMQKPILQNATNTQIREDYRIRKEQGDYWKNRKNEEGVSEAERAIFSKLDEYVKALIQ